MKKYFIILMLASVGLSQSYLTYTTNTIFFRNYSAVNMTVPLDSVKLDSAAGQIMYVHTIASRADTLQSIGFKNEGVQARQTVMCGVDSVDGADTHVLIYYGLYRGIELGWLWTLVDSLQTDGDYSEINIADTDIVSFSTLRVIDVWGIKLVEVGAQSNKLWTRIIGYKD